MAAIAVMTPPTVDTPSRSWSLTESEPQTTITSQLGGMIGHSRKMREVFTQIQRIAPHFQTVLITGETGTGKELVARALHELSPSRDGNFVTLNCSAVVETLFESELFGHVRGAFTDARTDKVGLFEFANGGTLFLDEIGDMPLATQAKLLRTLQSQEVLRVGSLTPRKVSVRVIAATNKDLHAAIAAKQFREDLYYRISMVEINLPKLRDRIGDLPALVESFGTQWSDRFHKTYRGMTPAVMEVLSRHSWPGNVRELENVVGHACMVSRSEVIDVDALPGYLRGSAPLSNPVPIVAAAAPAVSASAPLPLPDQLSPYASDLLEEYELRLIRQALDHTGQNQARAARLLRTTRDRLRYKMKKFGMLGEPVVS